MYGVNRRFAEALAGSSIPVSLSLSLNSKPKKRAFYAKPFASQSRDSHFFLFALVVRLNFLAFRLECNLFAWLANYIYQPRVETPRERALKAFCELSSSVSL